MLQLQHQYFQWIFKLIFFRIDWLDLLAVQGTLISKASIIWCSAFFIQLSHPYHFRKHQFFGAQLFIQLSHPYMTTGKIIALTIWTFVSKVMSLLFNTLSRFVIAFLPRTKHLLISWLQSLTSVILEPREIKSVTVSIFSPSICHEVMGPDAMSFSACWGACLNGQKMPSPSLNH